MKPLRVMYITDQDLKGDSFPDDEGPRVGSEYTAVEIVIGVGSQGLECPCYLLAEFSSVWCYDVRNFATLPASTASVMYEEECEAIIM